MKYAAAVAFLACIVGANWALSTFGIVPIGFGLMAPAGVYFAGLAFTARDVLRETSNRLTVWLLILTGAGLSFLLEDGERFAVASGLAFLFSESADALVYEPLRERSKALAVGLSNTVGLLIDSTLFLWLAFGSLQFIEGQVVGKAYMTALAVLGLWVWRALSQRRDQTRVTA